MAHSQFTPASVAAASGLFGTSLRVDPDGERTAELAAEYATQHMGYALTKALAKCPRLQLTDEHVRRVLEQLQ